MEKLKEYIDNIEQLSADVRYEENKDKIVIKLKSIKYWVNKGLSLLEKR